MEKNNTHHKPDLSKYALWDQAKLHAPYFLALIVGIIFGIYYYPKLAFISLFDTGSYDVAASNILSGKIDLLRTPVYPLFLAFCKRITHDADQMRYTAGVIQIVFYYISSFFLYKSMKYFIKNKAVLFFGTTIYLCATILINYNVMLLTETFSVVGVVIFTYLFLRYINKPQAWNIILVTSLAFFLIMLRPSAIYLFGVIAAIMALLFFIKKELRKQVIISFITLAVCTVLVISYMGINRSQNNYFGISIVSEINRFYDVAIAHIYTDNSDTEIMNEMADRIDNKKEWPLGVAIDIEQKYSKNDPARMRIAKFNNEAIRKHPGKYLKFLENKTLTMGSNHMLYSYSPTYFKEGVSKDIIVPGDYFAFNINLIYFLLLIELGMVVAIWRRKKIPPLDFILIVLLVGGQIAVNIVAGPAEFHRLNAPVYPLMILIFFKLIDASVQQYANTEKGIKQ